MTFSIFADANFLDWLCTIKEVCAMFFDITFLNKERVV